MSRMLVALTVLMSMNIMLYLGGIRLFDGDIVSRFYSISGDDVLGFSAEFNKTLPSSVLIAGLS